MKTTLSKMEDFMNHIKADLIKQVYFTVESSQKALAPPQPDVPQPIQMTAIMVFTAKSQDDKKAYSHLQVLRTAKITNEKEFDEYRDAVQKAHSAAIQEFQKYSPSCHLIEGVVE